MCRGYGDYSGYGGGYGGYGGKGGDAGYGNSNTGGGNVDYETGAAGNPGDASNSGQGPSEDNNTTQSALESVMGALAGQLSNCKPMH